MTTQASLHTIPSKTDQLLPATRQDDNSVSIAVGLHCDVVIFCWASYVQQFPQLEGYPVSNQFVHFPESLYQSEVSARSTAYIISRRQNKKINIGIIAPYSWARNHLPSTQKACEQSLSDAIIIAKASQLLLRALPAQARPGSSEGVLHLPNLAQVRGGRRAFPETRARLDRRLVRSHERVGRELFRDGGWHGVFAPAEALRRQSDLSLQRVVVRVDAPGEAIVAGRVLEEQGEGKARKGRLRVEWLLAEFTSPQRVQQ